MIPADLLNVLLLTDDTHERNATLLPTMTSDPFVPLVPRLGIRTSASSSSEEGVWRLESAEVREMREKLVVCVRVVSRMHGTQTGTRLAGRESRFSAVSLEERERERERWASCPSSTKATAGRKRQLTHSFYAPVSPSSAGTINAWRHVYQT